MSTPVTLAAMEKSLNEISSYLKELRDHGQVINKDPAVAHIAILYSEIFASDLRTAPADDAKAMLEQIREYVVRVRKAQNDAEQRRAQAIFEAQTARRNRAEAAALIEAKTKSCDSLVRYISSWSEEVLGKPTAIYGSDFTSAKDRLDHVGRYVVELKDRAERAERKLSEPTEEVKSADKVSSEDFAETVFGHVDKFLDLVDMFRKGLK